MPDGSRKFAHDGEMTFIPIVRRLCSCGHTIDSHNFTQCSHADYKPDTTRTHFLTFDQQTREGKYLAVSRCECALSYDQAYAALHAKYDAARWNIENI